MLLPLNPTNKFRFKKRTETTLLARLEVSTKSPQLRMQIAPSELFVGYTFSADTISIPLSALPGLTAAEADATTGNGMEVLRQVVDRSYVAIAALAPTARPTKATVAKPNPAIASGAGVSPGTLRQAYALTFDLQPTGLELASESP